MPDTAESDWSKQLADIRRQGLWRELLPLQPDPVADHPKFIDSEGRALLSFASNDYLGLSRDPALQRAAIAEMEKSGLGAAAAPLLGGERPVHQALAADLAAWLGAEAVLLFGSGYLANLGVISALVGRHDRVYADRLNHASLVDGVRLSGARLQRYRHGDMAHLQQLLARGGSGRIWIISDGVFSMDGDLAPLPEMVALARQYQASIILDEAHALGVLGDQGRGTLAHYRLGNADVAVIMGTLGKAFGVYGAFVAGSQDLIDLLRNRARSFIYHTAFPAALAAAARVSLQKLQAGEARRTRLHAHRLCLRTQLPDAPWLPSETPIQGLVLGDTARAVKVSGQLREAGLYCPAVRPPTVPQGSARLRVTLSAAHRHEDLQALLTALREIL
ncbi:8-amino-7-oxononanoate synthase [Acidithiobacillus sp. M4-SHS-6]|uniref:8-amino-7-oxononanoate synthase n=1 Tax=Acidithiobacillus sp. M4-SHS-6 TaxID=3383024 RepID=UPI0039BEB47D